MLLALALGKTVAELLDDLGDGELDLWYEYHKKHPLPDPWYQTGVTCDTFARYNGWHDHKTKPTDFMPIYREPLTPDQLFNKAVFVVQSIWAFRKPE